MSVNWIRLGKELGSMPGGVAVLRVLQAHKINYLAEIGKDREVAASCDLDMVIDYAHKEK